MMVADHDRKLISVHGPMFDDTEINDKVVDALNAGKHVNCCAVSADYETAIKEAKDTQPTYKLAEDALRPTLPE